MSFVKDEKVLYAPSREPSFIEVPRMSFLMVDGKGDPNEEDGAYRQAVQTLYALSYTIKMSKLGNRMPAGYFEYSVAPLEGLWQMDDNEVGVDYAHKERFCWTAMIRQPSFVTAEVFSWACEEVLRKKKADPQNARLAEYDEGRCVQCMHIGPYDDEPATVERLHCFMAENGWEADYEHRRHHELYLKDPRRTAPEKLKTILRIPIR